MKEVEKQAIVPYSSAQMYHLVNDVESYPLFLPGCTAVQLHYVEEGKMDVSVTVAKAGIPLTFRTENRLVPEESISMSLVQGPFDHLHGEWIFQTLGHEACKISFSLRFQLKGRVLNRALGPYFNELAGSMIDAFTQRARQRYGQ